MQEQGQAWGLHAASYSVLYLCRLRACITEGRRVRGHNVPASNVGTEGILSPTVQWNRPRQGRNGVETHITWLAAGAIEVIHFVVAFRPTP